MATTRNTIEEQISKAHVDAIVAQSGGVCDSIGQDHGTDLSVRGVKEVDGQLIDWGPLFEIQLKASINWTVSGDYVKYDMEVSAYNKLIERNSGDSSVVCLLVLCCLPKLQRDWLSVSESELILRNCCYYKLISGARNKNKSSVRIKVPRSQLFTPERARSLRGHILAGSVS